MSKRVFNVKETVNKLVEWIQLYFEENGTPETKAIVGISGGKDSSVVAGLCVKALGVDRVVGVKMPNGVQSDISFANLLIDTLGIKSYEVNIGDVCDAFTSTISGSAGWTIQAQINSPARIRMTTLYAISSLEKGRVANTCNYSEDYVGYATKFGDGAGDFSPLSNLTVTEVKQIGYELGLPKELIEKPATDGLCGKTDEDNLGFTYDVLDRYICTMECDDESIKEKIDDMHEKNFHKLVYMPCFTNVCWGYVDDKAEEEVAE